MENNSNLELNNWKNSESTIPKLFKEIVEKNKEKIAVICENVELTYLELDDMSNRLASFLYNNWVRPGSSVGIHFNKEHLYLVSCLATLKCGCAYIHMDSAYSGDILIRIVEENTPFAILSNSSLLNTSSIQACPIYTLDTFDDWRSTPIIDFDLINKENKPSKTAIIGYTSGTTGNPKGVAVPHQAALYSFYKFWEEIKDIKDKDRFGYLTYLAWDALSPLLCWASGIMISEEANENIELLFEELEKNKVNHIFLTPTLLKKILGFLPNKKFQKILEKIGVVWIWGEIIAPETVKAFMQAFQNSILINNYGPTECWVVSQGRLSKSKIHYYVENWVPNGNILPEISYKVLNENGNEIEGDNIGYLYVSGPALASHYIGNPELTAKKFTSLDNKTYFSTGDLCRVLADSELQIIGREDFLTLNNSQIIPIEEIETNIRQISGIKDCVIISSKRSLIDKDILIYYVEDTEIDTNNNELESKIKSIISQYNFSFVCININNVPMSETSQKIDYSHLIFLANNKTIIEK